MDRLTLAHIDEELESSEVDALRFLCQGLVKRKRLEGVKDAKELFVKLEERGLLENPYFLYQLLQTISRADLLSLLETDSRRPEETDANLILSDYRVMLYQIHEDMTKENLDKMKFLLSSKLGKRQIETCNTALDVFVEMEKAGLLSETKLDELHKTLLQLDQQQALTVQRYIQRGTQQPQTTLPSHVSMDYQPTQPVLSISETQHNDVRLNVCSDAEPNPGPSPVFDQNDYYILSHNPRGMCVIFNNEYFPGTSLNYRGGSQRDEKTLHQVFEKLGFTMRVYNDLTAEEMRFALKELGNLNFMDHDALVVCVLSHGEMGCVYGTDEKQVSLTELTQPFTSGRAPTLAGKPKLFFIQACQGSGYQRGFIPCAPKVGQEKEEATKSSMEEDAAYVPVETVPSNADFLLGMATVPEYKSFRHTAKGSIYIQELCMQLQKSAQSSVNDDILTILTRVNRVSKGEYLNYKQMPEPKYTLTKKLVLKFV
uniref:Caspase-8 n=1 Tax=Channa striata TaxID=64152 RepID=A0A0C6WCY1_CHASR|nr:caspase 8 [Channa striata]